jgi:hypothetical protein
MLGEYVLRELDLLAARAQPDVVALGSYNIDVREVERTCGICPAALAAEGRVRVQDVDVDALQRALRDVGQVLSEPRR